LFTKLLTDPNVKDVFDVIRFEAKDFSHKQILREKKAFDCLVEVYPDVVTLIDKISASKGVIEHYSSLFNYHNAWEHRRSSASLFYLYFSCFIYNRFKDINDHFVLAYVHHYKKIHADAKAYVKNRIISEREGMTERMVQAGKVLDLFQDEHFRGSTKFSNVRDKAYTLLNKEELSIVIKYLKSTSVDEDAYYWEYIDSIKSKNQILLRKLFLCLKFVERSSDLGLINQVNKLKGELENDNKCKSFDKRLINKRNRALLYDEDGVLIPNRAEFVIYRLVVGRISLHHWAVEYGSEYAPLEDSLISVSKFEEQGDALLAATNSEALNKPIQVLLKEKTNDLNDKLKRVMGRIQNKSNESVILSTSGGKKKWTVKKLKGQKEVNDRMFLLAPKKKISSIIAIVARDTNFSEHIKHIKGRNKDGEFIGKFIACVIANATRLGIYKMSEVCGYSYDELKKFEVNFLRTSTLDNASDSISDVIAKLGIFKHYNYRPDVVHGSIDGQKFRSRKNTIRTRYSSKDFGKGKGLSALTLSVNHVPVNADLMPLNHHESHYTFDLLYNNTSQIEPEIVSTDTHGTNRFNFALLDLFGWVFAPRYANVAGVIDGLFEVTESESGLALALRSPIKEDKIIEGWGEAQRICVSLHQKEIKQSDIVRKISRSSESDKSLLALREYDRLIKAIYILDYMDDESLRRYVQGALNRGEAYHQLQRAISNINGQSSFRGKSDKEIDLWYACARMLSNCVLYYNSAVLSNLLNRFKKENKNEQVEKLKKISPVAWLHIILNGQYFFDDLDNLPSINDIANSIQPT